MSTIQNKHGALFRVERITNQQSAKLDELALELRATRRERDAARAERDERCAYVSKLNTRWDQADRRYGEIALKLRVEAEQAARERDEARDERDEEHARWKATAKARRELERELEVVKAERDKLREALADARRMEGEK